MLFLYKKDYFYIYDTIVQNIFVRITAPPPLFFFLSPTLLSVEQKNLTDDIGAKQEHNFPVPMSYSFKRVKKPLSSRQSFYDVRYIDFSYKLSFVRHT